MTLKMMYITNNPVIAQAAVEAGVDRIMVDMENLGKSERQRLMNTVQNNHTLKDVCNIREVVPEGRLMVRCNPIHDGVGKYCCSEEEIEGIIECGADIIMLPYFKTAEEVRRFVEIVDGRAVTFPLLETPQAVEVLDDILAIPGIDEMHIGLNDLSLGYGKKFLFEVLADGLVDTICEKIRKIGIPYGFGGIASLGKGKVPAEMIIQEHYRLQSERVILSRSFCNSNLFRGTKEDYEEIHTIFTEGVERIREYERVCAEKPISALERNHMLLQTAVADVVREMEEAE